MIFDGGWRILSGQTPYKDFLMAFGPLTFFIQAAAFKLFGVNWTSMVIAAGILAAAAGLSVLRTISLLYGKQRIWLPGLAGLLVGTAFQSIFGTLFMEQVAFLFLLLGVQAICESLHCTPRYRFLFVALAGVLSVLSFLGKQNVGPFALALTGFLSVVLGLPHLRDCLKLLGAFLIGTAVATGLFIVWLVMFSDPDLFIRHALEVPAHVGRGRIPLSQVAFTPFLLSYIRGTTQWCYALALGGVFYILCLCFFDRDVREKFLGIPRYRVALALTAACPFVHSVFAFTVLNQPYNTVFFAGLILGLGYGLLGLIPGPEAKGRAWLTILVCFISPFLMFEIMYHGWQRDQHDTFPLGAADLSQRLRVPGMEHVRWITPTSAASATRKGKALEPQDIEDVYSYLASRKQDFFVLGDASYLYGLNGVIPPQPLLYFQKNHYYLEDDFVRLDDWILKSLKARDIRLIVREKVYYSGYFPFPNTLQWISDNFHPGPVFGDFEILLRE